MARLHGSWNYGMLEPLFIFLFLLVFEKTLATF